MLGEEKKKKNEGRLKISRVEKTMNNMRLQYIPHEEDIKQMTIQVRKEIHKIIIRLDFSNCL